VTTSFPLQLNSLTRHNTKQTDVIIITRKLHERDILWKFLPIIERAKKYHLLVELRAAKRPLLNLVAFFLYLDNCTSFRALMNPPAGQIDVFEKTHLRIDRFIILSWRSGERVVVQIWRWRNICGNK
jgi:hypothetical protein